MGSVQCWLPVCSQLHYGTVNIRMYVCVFCQILVHVYMHMYVICSGGSRGAGGPVPPPLKFTFRFF